MTAASNSTTTLSNDPSDRSHLPEKMRCSRAPMEAPNDLPQSQTGSEFAKRADVQKVTRNQSKMAVKGDELDTAFAAMARASADALIVQSDPALMDTLLGRVTALAATHRLPAMYSWRMYVEAGGLMSYGPSLLERHRRAATYVDKIFKGANPADLPVEQPTKFELVINLKTAKALGMTMPASLLLLADDVIQ